LTAIRTEAYRPFSRRASATRKPGPAGGNHFDVLDSFNKITSEWLNQGAGSIASLPQFLLNLVLALVLSNLVARFYVAYGRSLSNRRAFAKTFVLLAVVTTLIIVTVSASLALSLGLVGALSIVRFRAAIKDPEELVHLFLVIGIGIGLGANRPLFTTVGCLVCLAVIRLQRRGGDRADIDHKILSLEFVEEPDFELRWLTDLLGESTSQYSLRRLDESPDRVEVVFVVAFAGLDAFETFKQAVRAKHAAVNLTLLEPGLLVED